MSKSKSRKFQNLKFFLKKTYFQGFSQSKNTILMVFEALFQVKTRVLAIFRSKKSTFNVKIDVFQHTLYLKVVGIKNNAILLLLVLEKNHQNTFLIILPCYQFLSTKNTREHLCIRNKKINNLHKILYLLIAIAD